MYRQSLFFVFVISLFTLPLLAQKKVLDHSVYDSWKSFGAISVTDDGKFSVCVIKEQQGEDQILIRQLSSVRELIIPRGYNFSITPDQKFVVTLIGYSYTERSNDRLPQTGITNDKLPKDSLAIISLDRFSVTKIPHVSGFKMGKDFSEYIAFTSVNNNEPVLIIYRLAGGEKDTIQNAGEYIFSRNGKALAVTITEKDSTDCAKLCYFDLDKKYEKKIVSQKKTIYKNVTLSESGNKMAFFFTLNATKRNMALNLVKQVVKL